MPFSVPNRPTGSQTRDISQIIADFDAMATDYETRYSAYTDLPFFNWSNMGSGLVGAVTIVMDSGNGSSPLPTNLVEPSGASGLGPAAFDFDPADYASSGRTVKMRLKAWAVPNATAPAVTFTTGLYPVTSFGGAAGSRPTIATIGAVIANSTAVIATPAANALTRAASIDFTMPAAGPYVFAVAQSGTPSGSHCVLAARLQMRWSNP